MNRLNWGIGPCLVMVMSGCGDMSMPDGGSSIHGSSGNGAPVTPSSEVTFDLSKCGFELSKPTANISSRRMSMVPRKIIIPRVFVTYTYSLTGVSVIEESLSRSVTTFSAQSNPTSTEAQIEAALKQLSGGYTGDILGTTERAKIGSLYPDWKGVFCSLQPAIKIENGLTDKVVTAFDKPLPINPLIVADVARLKSEMAVKRTWSGITAKVIDSMNPEVPVGSTWTGRVSLSPVASAVTIEGPSGPQQIQSEFAVKMTYDFGSAAANNAIGLPSSVIWYVDPGTKMFKLTQVDFGDGNLVNYLPDR